MLAGEATTLARAIHLTYGSWLTLVERWFSELTTKQSRRGAHRSVRELERAIWEFVEAHNDEPRPFRVDDERRRDPRQHRSIRSAHVCGPWGDGDLFEPLLQDTLTARSAVALSLHS
jgi:hypothetical protein